VNVDHHQGIAVKYGIQSIPTVMLFKNGQMVKKWVGVVQKGTLAEALTAP
jgi:thioredoxin 1